MSSSQIQSLLQKIKNSASPDVQRGAIRNLLSKIQCGIISIEELMIQIPDCSLTLLNWIIIQANTNLFDQIQNIFDLLTKLAISSPNAKQQLQNSVYEICKLREQITEHQIDVPQIDRLLSNIIEGNQVLPISNKDTQIRKFIEIPNGSIRILQKPVKEQQEYIYLPQIRLTETDEKLLFDVSVQLKFGNNQTILQTLKDPLKRVFNDFPVEIFRQKYEIIEELVLLSNCQKEKNIQYYSLSLLIKFVKKLIKRFSIKRGINNYNQDQAKFLKDSRDYIVNSYPSLDPKQEENQSSESNRTLKNLIEIIIQGISSNINNFIGRRIVLLNQIYLFLEKVISLNQNATIESVIITLEQITLIFDQNEQFLQSQQMMPLYVIGLKLLLILPQEAKYPNLNRFYNYLASAQFTFLFTEEQSHQLTQLLSNIEMDFKVNGQYIQNIIQSLDIQWKNQSQLTNEVICLNREELVNSIRLHSDLLIGIPISDNLQFIKNYITHCLYLNSEVFDLEEYKDQILSNFHIVLTCPNKTVQQIIFTTMNQNLFMDKLLKVPKGSKLKETISQLQLQMLQDQDILSNLFSIATQQQSLYKILIDMLIEVLQHNPSFNLKEFYQILISNTDHCPKKTTILMTLISGEDSEIEYTKLLMDLYSKKQEQRKKSSKILFKFSQLKQQVQQQDFMEQILNHDSISINFRDEIDQILEQTELKSIIDVTIDQLSNLESLALSKSNEISIRISSVDQLSRIMILYNKYEKEVLRSAQVKEQLMREYLESMLDKLYTLINEIYQILLIETSISKISNNFQLLAKLLDLMTVSYNLFKTNQIETALFTISVSEIKSVRYSAFRYLYTILFSGNNIQKSNYIQLYINESTSQQKCQYWNKFYPIKQQLISYIQSYQIFLSEGVSYSQYQQKALQIKIENEDFIRSLDIFLAYQQVGIQCTCEQKVFEDLRQTMLSQSFLESNNTYLLHLISNYSETQSFWISLLNQVFQIFLETVGQEQIEYLFLFVQLQSVVKSKSDISKHLLTYLPRTQFNQRVAGFVLKLLKYKLIEPIPDLLKYLQQSILSHSFKLNYENSHNLIKLLSLSRSINLFEEIDELDQSILFSRLLQQSQSHLQSARSLAISLLSDYLKYLNEEQIVRIEDMVLDSVFQNNESEQIYSMNIALLIKLSPINKLNRIVSFTQQQLKLDINQMSKAGLLKLVFIYMVNRKDEAIPLVYNLQLDQYCSRSISCLKQQDSEFLALHSTQILNILMRQSVSKSLMLIQSHNLIEIVIKSIYKINKFLKNKEQSVIPQLMLQLSHIFQFATHYHKDYVEIELKRTLQKNPKWNIFNTISNCISNDQFSIYEKIGISKILICLYQVNLLSNINNDDLICGLVGIYRNAIEQIQQVENEETQGCLSDMTQILSALVSNNYQAKLICCKSGIARQISQFINKELELYIYEPQQSKQNKMVNSKQLNKSQSFIDQNQLGQSLTIRINTIYLKLLFKYSQEEIEYDNNFSDIIAITLQIIEKMLHLVIKFQNSQLIDYMHQICVNLGSNVKLQQFLSQQLSEQKWQIILNIQKILRMDSLTNQQISVLLQILGVFGQNQDIRLVYTRQKIIEEIQERLVKNWENKKKWQPLNHINQQMIMFISSLSFYKDCQIKILNSQQFFTIIIEILNNNQIEEQICQDIILILNNCALNTKLKKTLLVNQKFAPIIINIITDTNYQPEHRFKASQILLNIFYKCTAAVSMFNKNQVYESLEYTMKESQRQVDKLRISNDKITLISKKDEEFEKVGHLQNLSNNINQLLKILTIEW